MSPRRPIRSGVQAAQQSRPTVLSYLDELGFDQLWLMAVDTGDGLTDAEAAAILRFRRSGGGVLTARDHQDLGCCLSRLESLGLVNEFHDPSVDQTHLCDDLDTPISRGPTTTPGPPVTTSRSSQPIQHTNC